MLIVNPAYKAVTERWFDPDFWGAAAQPVDTGGRGGAWFIETDDGAMVLRHYLRGGLIAYFSERSYFYSGAERTRSANEFRLLLRLFEAGLPVPEPIAAWSGRHLGLWYRAAIIVRRIEGAVPMPNAPALEDAALWERVGRMIRRFHDFGLDHIDLNCDNILIAGDRAFLIDLDRCQVKADGSTWKTSNLNRLWRSVEKRMETLTKRQKLGLWQSLLVGYNSDPHNV
ncbi:3-deoxy-D-manno-octulosonic acid kinase [Marinobacter confluentis]|uniref:3-deoxy-D-manno-octulosonic acid kinase n=1 Tax=Marinobacter confluentis TaxID=1697557 RepID=A0A4Z1C778_9GAMM|nr:3-deoxy-D-manno-octulosonic acid kinase [Marinobacter confluentis]TGN38525.1 3-deoxy-D-manno-octulosonic acid kinase [Marinobacter confluentis]